MAVEERLTIVEPSEALRVCLPKVTLLTEEDFLKPSAHGTHQCDVDIFSSPTLAVESLAQPGYVVQRLVDCQPLGRSLHVLCGRLVMPAASGGTRVGFCS